MRRVLFVINPKAGSQKVSEFEHVLQDVVSGCMQEASCDIKLETMLERDPHDLRVRLDERLAQEDIDTVGVVGGDGSIMEVLPVLVRYPHVRLGLVPFGTGNLLALNLGIPPDLRQSLCTILSGSSRPIDIGCIGNRYFALLAGIGVVADIMQKTTSRHKQLFGWWAYFVDGVSSILRPNPGARFRLVVDGQSVYDQGVALVISNAASIMRPCPALTPDAEPDDGQLDICLLRANTRRDNLATVYDVLTRRCAEPESPHIRYFTARHLRVESQPRLKVQADGNLIGYTPVDVRILPRHLHVMVPAPASEPTEERPDSRPAGEVMLDLLRMGFA